LQPVLDTLVETAARICNGDSASLTIREDEVYRYVAMFALAEEFYTLLRNRTFTPSRGSVAGRTALEGKVVHVADITADPEYRLAEAVTMAKVRTCLGVPLLRDGVVIGTVTVNRQRVEPFTERQIELVQTFADQAVIAIENVRLFEAEQQRTRELSESLEQQTATSDVAVCCSSDSVSSRVRCCSASNNRAFSIAISAWSRKDSAWAISTAPKALGRFPISVSKPIHSPSRSSGK